MTLTIRLSEDSLARLQEMATRFQIPMEVLARVGVEDLLRRPDDDFYHAMQFLLQKNAELYRRLA